jgi:type IV secretory pathway protease TraF
VSGCRALAAVVLEAEIAAPASAESLDELLKLRVVTHASVIGLFRVTSEAEQLQVRERVMVFEPDRFFERFPRSLLQRGQSVAPIVATRREKRACIARAVTLRIASPSHVNDQADRERRLLLKNQH